MRIVILGNFGLRKKGTMAVRALPLARALVDRGHEISIVLPAEDSASDSPGETFVQGIKVVQLAASARIPILWHLCLAGRLLRRGLCEKPDVIYGFKPKAYVGLALLIARGLRRLGICSARLVLDTDDWEGTGGWNEREHYPMPIKWLIAWHEGWCLRNADALTVASRALQTLAWSAGVAPRSIYYVPNGVWEGGVGWRIGDGSGVRERLGLLDRPVVLLYTRFVEFDVGRPLAVLATVRRAVPQTVLLVVGKGLDGEERQAEAIVRQNGLADSVRFVGWVSTETLPDYFAAADVAIYPLDDNLLNRAKCPVKLLDLLLAGVPVVVDRVGQSGEYLEDGRSGMLIEAENQEAMAQCVIDLLRDEPRRRALGMQAREDIWNRFHWSHLARNAELALQVAKR